MKNVTRTIAVQPVRVFFIINVIVTGKMPIRSLLIESKAYCHCRSGLSSPTDRLDTAYAASALEGCAVAALRSSVASRIFR